MDGTNYATVDAESYQELTSDWPTASDLHMTTFGRSTVVIRRDVEWRVLHNELCENSRTGGEETFLLFD